jgi:hypothetical protein
VAAATTIANLTSIYQELTGAGILVVACTVSPTVNANTASRKANLITINNWIREYAANNAGVVLCDWYLRLANPATGDPATNMTVDGVHPTQMGAFLMGQQLANTLTPLFPVRDPLPFSNAELNGSPNPCMVGATAGLATSTTLSSQSGTPTLTPSKVTRTDGVQGEWQQVVATGGTDSFWVQQQVSPNVGSTGLQVGDWVYLTAEVEIDAGATMVGHLGEHPVDLTIISQDAPGNPLVSACFTTGTDPVYSGPIPTGRLILRTLNFQIPAGSSRLFLRVSFYVNGTVRVGRMQIYKAAVTGVYG